MNECENWDITLRLSAQAALRGQVPSTLRAVSVALENQTVVFRSIFDGHPSEHDQELLSCAATEVIADFPDTYTIREEYLGIKYPLRMEHLQFLIFLRFELPISAP